MTDAPALRAAPGRDASTAVDGQRLRLEGAVCSLRPEQAELLRGSPVAAALRVAGAHLDELAITPGTPEVAAGVKTWQRRIDALAATLAHGPGMPRLQEPARLRVALAGRTEAGKSSLLNAMVGRTVVAVGDGEQRTTRTVSTHRIGEAVELVDTPGVAATGGVDDEAAAAAAASECHLVLYVFSDDQIGRDEVEALRRVGGWRPGLAALNFKLDVDGRRGGRPAIAQLNRERLLTNPREVFSLDDLKAHVDRLGDLSDDLVVRLVEGVHPIHALAGVMAHEDREDAEALWDASGVGRLAQGLDEVALRWFAAAEVARTVTPWWLTHREAVQTLAELRSELRTAEQRLRRHREGWEKRLERIVDLHATRFANRLTLALAPLRDAIPEMIRATDRSVARELRERIDVAGVDRVLRKHLDDVAAELAEELSIPHVEHGEVRWQTATVRLPADVDGLQIFLEALGEAAVGAGIRGAMKLIGRLLARAGAAAGPSGGAGAIVLVLVEVARLAARFRRKHRAAHDVRDLKITHMVREALDETRDRLIKTFRRRVMAGEIDQAVNRHRSALLAAEDAARGAAQQMHTALDRAEHAEQDLLALHLELLDGVYGTGDRVPHIRRDDDGMLRVVGDIPWAALVALEWSTGERPRTCDDRKEATWAT